jgi:hypothetical protein
MEDEVQVFGRGRLQQGRQGFQQGRRSFEFIVTDRAQALQLALNIVSQGGIFVVGHVTCLAELVGIFELPFQLGARLLNLGQFGVCGGFLGQEALTPVRIEFEGCQEVNNSLLGDLGADSVLQPPIQEWGTPPFRRSDGMRLP